jgi:hypothetical protein
METFMRTLTAVTVSLSATSLEIAKSDLFVLEHGADTLFAATLDGREVTSR